MSRELLQTQVQLCIVTLQPEMSRQELNTIIYCIAQYILHLTNNMSHSNFKYVVT